MPNRWLALAALILAAVSVGGPQSADALSAGEFPYHGCASYDCSCSPYSLNYLESVREGPLLTRHCFSIGYVGCDRNRRCCRGMLAAVSKLSLQIEPECQKNNTVRVTVNGQRHYSWTTYDHSDAAAPGYEMRLYDLAASNKTFPDTQICFFTTDVCPLQKLCTGPGGQCAYSFTDTSNSTYCPTCYKNLIPRPPPRSPVAAPPPPAVVPANGTCPLCFTISILAGPSPPPDPHFTITPLMCDDIQASMIANLQYAAQESGAALVGPLTAAPCTPLQVRVCGVFASDADTYLLAPAVQELGQRYMSEMLGVTCTPATSGYVLLYEASSTVPDTPCLFFQDLYSCTDAPPPPPPLALPPPPPGGQEPPPPPLFAACVSNLAKAPYTFSGMTAADSKDQYGNPVVELCASIQAKSCGGTAACCRMDVDKATLAIADSCRSAVRSVSVNGQTRSYNWAYMDGFTELRITSLGSLKPVGAKLCWKVLKNSACSNPKTFCYTGYCQIAAWSSNRKCCPTTVIWPTAGRR